MKLSGLALVASTSCVALAFVPSSQVAPITKIGSSASSSASSSPLFAEATNGANGDLVANGDTVNGLNGMTTGDLLGLPARPGRPLKVAIAGGMSDYLILLFVFRQTLSYIQLISHLFCTKYSPDFLSLGGVGGLTTALCMLKRGFDVTVYEKTAAFARFGGPIQFASNALSVLKEIDEGLFDRVMDKFTFTGTRACGIKDGLRADGSFRMTGDSLDYLVNPDAPADWFVKFPLKQCADLYGLPYTGVVDRPDLQEILIDECKKLKPDFIQNGNPVTSYENLGENEGVKVTLADGSTADADILVGSDGIWSAVRAQMYGEEIKKSSSNLKKRQGCTYSGYTVFAGETVIKTPDYYETGYKVCYVWENMAMVNSIACDSTSPHTARFFCVPLFICAGLHRTSALLCYLGCR